MIRNRRCLQLYLGALILCAWLAAGRPARAADAKARSWALIVGIDDYKSPAISSLRFAVADAKSIGAVLAGRFHFEPGAMRLMTSDANGATQLPTSHNILDALDKLADTVGPNDTFFFYFSGHGFQLPQGNFLASIDADPTGVDSLINSAVPLNALRQRFRRIAARQVIMVLDCCRNDPTAGRSMAANVLRPAFAKDLAVVSSSSNGGSAGAAVLFACSTGERAWEWPEMKHGVFTYYLLDGLQGKGLGPDGAAPVSGVAEYVHNRVLEWTKDQKLKPQTPDFEQTGALSVTLGKAAAVPVAIDPNRDKRWQGRPRIMVVVPETMPDGREAASPTTENEIIRQLIDAGLDVIDGSEVSAVRSKTRLGTFVQRPDTATIKRFAAKYLCDIIVVGTASVQNEGKTVGDLCAADARADVKVIEVDSSRVLTTVGKAAGGAGVTPPGAAKKALSNVAYKIAKEISNRIDEAINNPE